MNNADRTAFRLSHFLRSLLLGIEITTVAAICGAQPDPGADAPQPAAVVHEIRGADPLRLLESFLPKPSYQTPKISPVGKAKAIAVLAFQNFVDVHIDVQNPGTDEAPTQAVTWEDFGFSYQTSKFDLALFVVEEAGAVKLTLEYDSQLFLADTIREQLQTLAHFAGLLAGPNHP